MNLFRRLPLFWRFQLFGWVAFCIFSFPLKWVLLENIPGSVLVSLYRDGLGFILTLGMREIYKRVYPQKMRPAVTAILVAAVSVVGGGLLTLFSVIFHAALDFEESKIFTTSVILAIFYFRTGLCAGWSLLYFGIRTVCDGTLRDLRLAQAETERERAELQMLRAQMNPHFILNALNTVMASVGKEVEHTKALIRALAQYLQYSLKNRTNDLVPFGDEIDALRGFLDVECARFVGKLITEFSIDHNSLGVLVPGILLQPLIENAIKYGRRTSRIPRIVRVITACTKPGILSVEVSNTGSWVQREESPSLVHGIGLGNLRRRLETLYPGRHVLSVRSFDGWVHVRLEIPTGR